MTSRHSLTEDIDIDIVEDIPEDNESVKTFKTVLTQTKPVGKPPAFIPYKTGYNIPNSPNFWKTSNLATNIASSSSSSKSSKNQTEYFYKKLVDSVFILENEILKKFDSPHDIVNEILPPTHFYLPENILKSQKYYEQILVQSKSININYTYSKDGTPIYCKVLLLNTITLGEWDQPSYMTKEVKMPDKGPVLKYNYWDYIDAWKRAFLFQNSQFRFSIFFHFGNHFQYPTTKWFLPWWEAFGPDMRIMPPPVLKAFKIFESQFIFKEDYKDVDPWAIFSQLFHVPWIVMTDYYICDEAANNAKYSSLCRFYKTKWWDKTDIKNCDENAVDLFFKRNKNMSKLLKGSSSSKKPLPSAFATRRAQIIEKINNCTNEIEIEKLLQELSEVKSNSDNDSEKATGVKAWWEDSQPY